MDWWGFLIIIIIIIIVVIIIVIAVFRPFSPQNIPLNGKCDEATRCQSGLICDNGVCKVPIGGACSTDNDCVSRAAGCQAGICQQTVTAPPPPQET